MRPATGLALLCAACLALTGCGAYRCPVEPPEAVLHTDILAPLDPNVQGETLGEKKGTASSRQLLSLFAWGDASIQAAAEAGEITIIRHVDYRFVDYFRVYSRFTTIVYGD